MQRIKMFVNKIKNKIKPFLSNLTVDKKALVTSFIIAITVIGTTVLPQGLATSSQKQKMEVSTISRNVNYFAVSLDNEKKNGLLTEVNEKAKLQKEKDEKARILKVNAEKKILVQKQAEKEKLAKDKAKKEQIKTEQANKKKLVNIQSLKKQSVSSPSLSRGGNLSEVYNRNVPMPRDQQEYLYKKVRERGLDYKNTLAVIKHESDFQVNQISETNDYGYFQINIVNHRNLSATLGTPNSPLNPYVNIDWGTYMLSDLYSMFRAKGLNGQALEDAVLSSYNKGVGGYSKTGKAVKYLLSNNKARAEIENWF